MNYILIVLAAVLFSIEALGIIGGSYDHAGEWKYTVGVNDDCSGFLVHKRVVLTSGHCIPNRSDEVVLYLREEDGREKAIKINVIDHFRRLHDYDTGETNVKETLDELGLSLVNRLGDVPWRKYLYGSDDPTEGIPFIVSLPTDGAHLLDGNTLIYEIDFGVLLLEKDVPSPFEPLSILKTQLKNTRLNTENMIFTISGLGTKVNPRAIFTRGEYKVSSALYKYLGYSTSEVGDPPVSYYFDALYGYNLTGATSGSGGYVHDEACVGDSGGPVVLYIDGKKYAAGVYNSGFHPNCANGATAASISSYVHNLKDLEEKWNVSFDFFEYSKQTN